MLTSITPLGERGRTGRWGVTVGAYLLGSTAGGAAVGTALGLLGAGLAWLLPGRHPALAWVLAALAALAGVALDRGWAGMRLPSPRRQVDEDWLHRYRGWVYGVGFGAQLGVGVATIVTSASVYVALVMALLAGSWWGGLAVGTAFGLVRALPVLALRRVRTPVALAATHRRVAAWAPRATAAAVGAQAALALGATVALAVTLR